MRTAVSKTYDNGDGSYQAVVWSKPVHYQAEDGTWEDLDEADQSSNSRSREIDTLQPDGTTGKDTIISDNTNQDMNIGGDPEFWFTADSGNPFFKFRILIQFNVESLNIPAESEITSASLMLYYFRSITTDQSEAGASSPIGITAYGVTRSWVEGTGTTSATTSDGATWNDYDGTNSWGSVGGDYTTTKSGTGSTPTSYGWTTIDVKNIVGVWVDETLTNNGFILIGDSSHQYLKRFHTSDYSTSSERPKLVIDYVSNKPPVIDNPIHTLNLDEDAANYYLSLDRDQFIDGIFKDPDVGDSLSFFVWNGVKWAGISTGGAYDSENLTATVQQNGTLEIALKPNEYGVDDLKLNATDTDGASTIHNLRINIKSVNDPPKISDTTKWFYDDPEPSYTTGTLTCLEDQWVNFTIKANDPVEPEDNAKLKYYVNSTEDYAGFFEVDESTGEVSFMAINDDVGIYKLKITVDDTNSVNNIDEYTFTLEVENVNDKPIITEIAFQQFTQKIEPFATSVTLNEKAFEDSYYNFTVYADDEDLELEDSDESLKFSILPSNRFDVIKDFPTPKKYIRYSFVPTNDDVGTFTVQLSVTDAANEDTTLMVTINVINRNDPPVISNFYFGTQIKDLEYKQYQSLDLEELGKVYTVTEGELYTFSVKGLDFDLNDEIEFEVEIQNRSKTEQKEMLTTTTTPGENPNEVSSTLELKVTPDHRSGRDSEMWINISAIDKADAEGLLMLRIPVENINDPPPESTITVEINDADRETRFIKENLSVIFTAKEIFDPDGDNVTYSWDFDEADGITEDMTGSDVVWTYSKDGTYTVTLTVDDGNGGTNSSEKSLQVIAPPKKGSGSNGVGGILSGFGLILIILIVIIVVVILVIVAAVMYMRKKKHEKEEAEEAERQQQMMAQTQFGIPMAQDPSMMMQDPAMMMQDPAMMAQFQALQQQQMMMQYPEQYQDMSMQPQYGYDQTGMMQQQQPMDYQQMEMQQMGMGVDAYGQPLVQPQMGVQTVPMQSAVIAEGQAMPPAPSGELGLPATGVSEQPQLPPAAVEEEPPMPESPFAAAETQTLEEELGTDAEIAEIPIEPDTSAPEPTPDVEPVAAPETTPTVAPTPAPTQPTPTVEEQPPAAAEGAEGDKKCGNCNAPVKEGWFLCPECKQPLL
jgi:hypothetical protein